MSQVFLQLVVPPYSGPLVWMMHPFRRRIWFKTTWAPDSVWTDDPSVCPHLLYTDELQGLPKLVQDDQEYILTVQWKAACWLFTYFNFSKIENAILTLTAAERHRSKRSAGHVRPKWFNTESSIRIERLVPTVLKKFVQIFFSEGKLLIPIKHFLT